MKNIEPNYPEGEKLELYRVNFSRAYCLKIRVEMDPGYSFRHLERQKRIKEIEAEDREDFNTVADEICKEDYGMTSNEYAFTKING